MRALDICADDKSLWNIHIFSSFSHSIIFFFRCLLFPTWHKTTRRKKKTFTRVTIYYLLMFSLIPRHKRIRHQFYALFSAVCLMRHAISKSNCCDSFDEAARNLKMSKLSASSRNEEKKRDIESVYDTHNIAIECVLAITLPPLFTC